MKKLLIIAGAGSSVELGMPSVGDIDTLFEKWALELTPLAEDQSKSLYSFVRDKIQEFYDKDTSGFRNKTTNFEEILNTIAQLSALENPNTFSPPVRAFINSIDLPAVKYLGKRSKASSEILFRLYIHLVDQLFEYFRKQCVEVENMSGFKEKFQTYKDFFNRISEDFELGIISLNYDNLILQALPGLRTGFDRKSGKLLLEEILLKNEFGFCYQLHGSVYFNTETEKDQMYNVFWNEDLTKDFSKYPHGRFQIHQRKEDIYPKANIIAGGGKELQILDQPFRSYYNVIDRALYDADAILFLGYGYGDSHINKCFMGLWNRVFINKLKPVLIVDYCAEGGDFFTSIPYNKFFNIGKSLKKDTSYEMRQTGILTNPVYSGYEGNKDIPTKTNPKLPLAVWPFGFLDFCKKYVENESIFKYLDGNILLDKLGGSGA